MTGRNALIWTCIVLVGLPVGYFARGYFYHPKERDRSALELFETYCVPLTEGQLNSPDASLVRLERVGGLGWVDPETVIFLRISDDGCSVSDVLAPMNSKERKALDDGVAPLIERKLPQLTLDQDARLDLWSAFLFWQSHPRGDDRRWGVMFSRVSSESDSETTLSLSYPINDEVSEKLNELRKGS